MTVGQLAVSTSPRPGRRELVIAVTVFVAAWVGCRLYLPAFRAGGGQAMSYYDQFAPAVMAACGRGFVNPPLNSSPALDAFLLNGAQRFDCRSLSASSAIEPLNDFQIVTRNLLLSAAAIWRVTGISWTALDSLAATMFAVTLTAAYLATQFVLGRALAIIGVLVWGLSPMHLENVPHLRDYSKAPFFALAVLAIALAIRARRPKIIVAVGAIFGVVQGIGLGMRTDVVLNFAPFFLALFALGGGGLTSNIRSKFAAAVASLLLFVLVAWPVLTAYHRSEGLWHVSLLGLTTPFDAELDLRRAPYNFGYLYDDSYMSTVVHGYWYRVHGPAQVALHGTGLYDKACKEYYALLTSTFPADVLTRMAASALRVLNLPFSIRYGIVPLGVTNALMTVIGRIRAFTMIALAGIGPLAAAYLLVLVGIRDRVAACVGFVLLLFWATYPYLQFHGRHVFHLEILAIVVLLWAARLSWSMVAGVTLAEAWARHGRRTRQSATMIAALVCVALFALGVARIIQRPRVEALFEKYANAVEEPIEVQSATAEPGSVRLTPRVFEPSTQAARFQQAMLVLNVTATCESSGPVHVRYQGTEKELDFSHDVTVPFTAGTRAFVPVYSIERADGRVSGFADVVVPASSASCVRLSRAREIERSPVMLDAVLPSDWRKQPLHERVSLSAIVTEHVWVRITRWWPRVGEIG